MGSGFGSVLTWLQVRWNIHGDVGGKEAGSGDCWAEGSAVKREHSDTHCLALDPGSGTYELSNH